MKEADTTTEKERTAGDETAVYELGYHVVSTLAEGGVPEEANAIKSMLETQGATLVAEEFPVPMKLAYTIIHRATGKNVPYDTSHFGWVKFELEPEKVTHVKAELDKRDNLLRFIIIRTVKEDTRAPKHVLIVKQEADKTIGHKSLTTTPKAEQKGPVSEEELDKTIEELVKE